MELCTTLKTAQNYVTSSSHLSIQLLIALSPLRSLYNHHRNSEWLNRNGFFRSIKLTDQVVGSCSNMSHKPQGNGSLCLNNPRETGCLHPPRSHENCLDSRSQRPGSGTHALFDSVTTGTIPALHTAPRETVDIGNPDGKPWESGPFKVTF